MYLLWQAWPCQRCRAASPAALALCSRQTEELGGDIRAFHSGDVSDRVSDDIGIRPYLTGLVQEFGSTTWPCPLCFSSNSSIKWSSRASLQVTTWSELAWPHGLAPCPGPTQGTQQSSALLLLPQPQPDPPGPSVTQG